MNDFNSAQENRHPRLLMQFDKQEKVPKLVSINQTDSHGYQNYQTKNSQTQRQFYVRNRQQKIDKDPRLQAIRLQRELQMEKLQKIELQSIIKELTIKSQRLKQINQHLILRLKEVQKNYIQNRSELQKENQQECRKLKNNIYLDVQTYVKSNIETLKISLQGEKMNPKVQQKIQNFMEEMLQINSHSVEMLKISRRKQPPNHLHFLTESNLKKGERTSVEKLNIANLSLQNTEKKYLGPQKSEYQTLLKHLSRQKSKKELTNSFYQSSYNNNFRTNQKDRSRYWNQHQYQNRNHSNSRSMFRNQYSTTPHKRKKIFQKFYRS